MKCRIIIFLIVFFSLSCTVFSPKVKNNEIVSIYFIKYIGIQDHPIYSIVLSNKNLKLNNLKKHLRVTASRHELFFYKLIKISSELRNNIDSLIFTHSDSIKNVPPNYFGNFEIISIKNNVEKEHRYTNSKNKSILLLTELKKKVGDDDNSIKSVIESIK